MKKYIFSILVSILVIACGIIALAIFYMSLDRRTISIEYNAYETMGNNQVYEGSIGTDSVCIKKYNGEEFSKISIDLLDMFPDEILFGKKYYYLLQYDEDESVMVQLDYNSKIKKRRTIKGLVRAFCSGEYVLMLLEKENRNYSKYQNSKCINYYIKERDFEKNLVEITKENSKALSRVIKLSYHHNGLFSLIPDVGVEAEELFFYDKVRVVKENKENGAKKWIILNQLVEQMEMEMDMDNVIYVKCYQDEEKIYGICNVLTYKFVDESIRTKDIKKSIYFIYDSGAGGCTIVHSAEKKCGILFNKKAIYYEKDGVIYEYNLDAKKERKIYQADKSDDMNIKLFNNILKIFVGNSWEGNKEEIIIDLGPLA